MRILIIGGTGCLGPFIVRKLATAGHQITVFHRGEHEPNLPKSVRHVHSPSAEFPVVTFPPVLAGWEPDVVLHMVAMGERDAGAAVHAFEGVAKRLIVASSGDVYAAYGVLLGSESATQVSGLLKEDSPLRQNLYPYGKGAKRPADWIAHYEKILVERAVMSNPRLQGTVLRLPAVYGPGDSQHRFLPFLKRMDDRRPTILLDEGQARWRWTHGYVENVAAAIALAVLDNRSAGRIYNVGEEFTPTVEQRVQLLAQTAGWAGEIVKLPRALLPSHLRDNYNYARDVAYDTTRIRRELGYREEIGIEEGMRRTIVSLRSNPSVFNSAEYDYAAEDAVLKTIQNP